MCPLSASEKEIKLAYRRLLKEYHPDIPGNGRRYEEKVKEINSAYACLSDPEKRACYDQNEFAGGAVRASPGPDADRVMAAKTRFLAMLFRLGGHSRG